MVWRDFRLLKGLNSGRVLAAAFVVVFTLLLYSPALKSAFLRDDDLAAVTVVRTAGPWADFGLPSDAVTLWYSEYLYRPLFSVQTWALHQAFTVNYAGYQIVLVLALCVAAAALLALFLRIGLDLEVAGLLALLFVSHPFVSPLVIWVSDVAVWQHVLVALCVLLLLRASARRRDYVFLLLLLLAAALMRENGLALIAAGAAFAVLAWRAGEYSKQRAAGVILSAILCVLVNLLCAAMPSVSFPSACRQRILACSLPTTRLLRLPGSPLCSDYW